MEKVAISGFEPFDGYSINPSAEIVKILDGTDVFNKRVYGIVLPLDYKKADSMLKDFIVKHNPKYVLCCGQANRAALTLEFVGLNVVNTSRKDNYDFAPSEYIIKPDAPAAYFSTIDVHGLVDQIKTMGIPAAVSYHAGTYGCNWILFNVLNWIASGSVKAKATFIHLPPLPEQALEKDNLSMATMPLDMQVDAMRLILKALG